jgi:hypothetical protein
MISNASTSTASAVQAPPPQLDPSIQQAPSPAAPATQQTPSPSDPSAPTGGTATAAPAHDASAATPAPAPPGGGAPPAGGASGTLQTTSSGVVAHVAGAHDAVTSSLPAADPPTVPGAGVGVSVSAPALPSDPAAGVGVPGPHVLGAAGLGDPGAVLPSGVDAVAGSAVPADPAGLVTGLGARASGALDSASSAAVGHVAGAVDAASSSWLPTVDATSLTGMTGGVSLAPSALPGELFAGAGMSAPGHAGGGAVGDPSALVPAAPATVDAGPGVSTGAAGGHSSAIHMLLPLDANTFRYAGLIALAALLARTFSRWSDSAGGCALAARAALAQFRLLPCPRLSPGGAVALVAVRFGEAHSAATSRLGAGGRRQVRRGRAAALPRGARKDRVTAAPAVSQHDHSSLLSGLEVAVLAILVALNIALLTVRNVFWSNASRR